MKFSLGCALGYDVTAPTTLILNVEVMRSAQQTVLNESLTVVPFAPAEPYAGADGSNLYRRLLLQPGHVDIRYEAEVELSPSHEDPGPIEETPIDRMPLEMMPWLYPSRYCQSDRLARFAWRQFGSLPTGHQRVTAICNWINSEVDYLSGASTPSTSAYDTFSLRAGVCRDFAHLGITFCRALGIPARFVSAYGWQLVPQDFHAVFEAYLGGKWYLFDATRMGPIDGIIRIGVGRDAADTAFSTCFGILNPAGMKVWVEAIDGNDTKRAWTTDAVSVAAE